MDVVVLGWEPSTRELVFVPVNDGLGGDRERCVVSEQSAVDVAAACHGVELPCVGTLLVYGDDYMVELTGPQAMECTARIHRSNVRLTDHRKGQQVASLPLDRFGISDPDLAREIGHNDLRRFLFFVAGSRSDGAVGCWVVEGGLGGWLDRQRAAAAVRKEQQEQKRRQRTFVNPYTFIPFPTSIGRASPDGHHRLGPGRLSGTMTVRWRFTSPFQAPEATVPGGRLRLPGASVKGAVRSVHEALAGGCLRVLNMDFVPSYRDTASALTPEWTLAVVAEVTSDGQPMTVWLCDQVVWVRAAQLTAAYGNQLRTGSRVTIDATAARWTTLERWELPQEVKVAEGGNWVVLLSDGGARRSTIRDSRTGRERAGEYFVACGHLPVDAARTGVTDDAWREFRRAVAGAREVQQRAAAARAGEPFEEWRPAKLRDRDPVGKRKAAADRLAKADVVWAHQAAQGDHVDRLRLSAIWRHAGKGTMAERVPNHLHGCDEPSHLCPSCRLFGATDMVPRTGGGRAEQQSYAGHVRFGDAVSDGEVTLEPVVRAPLGAPRPGAGQLYLRYDDPQPANREGELPTREWGAGPDEPRVRQVRGRKFYWHADPTRQAVPRHVAREHQRKARLATERLLAPAGTVLVQKVTFDNLSPAELGGLVATLEPHRVLPSGAASSHVVRLHLGGGKPLGLGSCHATVEDVQVWTAQSRYGGGDPVSPDLDEYVSSFVSSTAPEVTKVWPALAAVLAEDTVDPVLVWYPPGEHWTDQGHSQKSFDEPFAFFTATSGMHLAEKKQRPMQPLPEPTALDQSLPIIRKKDLDKGNGRR